MFVCLELAKLFVLVFGKLSSGFAFHAARILRRFSGRGCRKDKLYSRVKIISEALSPRSEVRSISASMIKENQLMFDVG
jgi:hypothetical protein